MAVGQSAEGSFMPLFPACGGPGLAIYPGTPNSQWFSAAVSGSGVSWSAVYNTSGKACSTFALWGNERRETHKRPPPTGRGPFLQQELGSEQHHCPSPTLRVGVSPSVRVKVNGMSMPPVQSVPTSTFAFVPKALQPLGIVPQAKPVIAVFGWA